MGVCFKYAGLPDGYAIHQSSTATPSASAHDQREQRGRRAESSPHLGCSVKRTFVRQEDSTDVEGGRILLYVAPVGEPYRYKLNLVPPRSPCR